MTSMKRRAAVAERALDQRHELLLVAREAAADVARAELQRHRHQVDRGVAVDDALLALAALVGGGRELALGEAVDAVVLDDVGHVDAAPHGVGELAEADRRRVAVAADAEVEQLAVGEVGAGQHRGHAAVHGVEAVRGAEEVVGRLRRAADARELGDAVRLDVELPAGLHQRRRDRVVAAAGAQGRDLALVVAPREAELVARQGRVVQLRLGEVGHAASPFLLDRLDVVGAHALGDRLDDEAGGDRRAVVVQDRLEPGRIDLLLVDQHHAQLGIAVLLDDEHRLVLGDEAVDRGAERERRARAARRRGRPAPGRRRRPRPSPGWSSRSRSPPKRVSRAALRSTGCGTSSLAVSNFFSSRVTL